MKSPVEALRRFAAELRERLRALLFRSRMERELDEELRFHIERQTEENLEGGMNPEEARRQARLAFGGVERYKEEVRDARGVRWLEEAAKDVRRAARRLLRDRGYSVPTVATLALGIGVAAAVFALVDGVLLRPLPYPEPDRLVAVRHVAPGIELAGTGLSRGTYQHYREHAASDDGSAGIFGELGVYTVDVRTLTDPGAPERMRMAMVSPAAFSILRATPHLGRLPAPREVEPGDVGEVLISHDLWVRRYGGDPGIVGRTIEISRSPDRVVGVAEPGFRFPDPETEVWIGWNFPNRPVTRAAIRNQYMDGIARLAPGVSVATARREIQRLVRSLPDAYPDITAEDLRATGLRADIIPFRESVVGDVRTALLLLLGTAAFLLLITWANATNLTLVRAERRRREAAVERALGATGWHLGRRFFIESVILALVGGALGLGLAYAAVGLGFGFQPGEIPRLGEVGLDGNALGVTLGLMLSSAMLLGTASFLSVRRPDLTSGLTGALGRATASPREQMGRRILVAGQVALALTLLIGSALMARSFWQLHRVELGFEPEGALTFFLPVSPAAYPSYRAMSGVHDDILARIRALPGVDAAESGTISGFPLTPVPSYYERRIAAASTPEAEHDDAPYALFGFATPGYFRALGVPLVRGRGFRPDDTARETPGVVLSRSLARALFGDADPVGRRVRWARTSRYPDYTVVGVAGDVPGATMRDGPSRAIYFPNIHPPRADTVTGVLHIYIPNDEMYVIRTELPPTSLMPAIRRAIEQVDPKLVPTRVSALERVVADSLARARLTMLLLLVGAATALFLGVIGIYGVLAYTVRARTPELGVRLALGATPGAVTRMVVRRGALLALAGIAIGTAAAFALTRFLRGLLYEVSPTDPAAFVGMAVLLLAVALAASYLPARRAARVDPVRALKAE